MEMEDYDELKKKLMNWCEKWKNRIQETILIRPHSRVPVSLVTFESANLLLFKEHYNDQRYFYN
jgi:hypothetical protein